MVIRWENHRHPRVDLSSERISVLYIVDPPEMQVQRWVPESLACYGPDACALWETFAEYSALESWVCRPPEVFSKTSSGAWGLGSPPDLPDLPHCSYAYV